MDPKTSNLLRVMQSAYRERGSAAVLPDLLPDDFLAIIFREIAAFTEKSNGNYAALTILAMWHFDEQIRSSTSAHALHDAVGLYAAAVMETVQARRKLA